jgi:hypothetical protein
VDRVRFATNESHRTTGLNSRTALTTEAAEILKPARNCPLRELALQREASFQTPDGGIVRWAANVRTLSKK